MSAKRRLLPRSEIEEALAIAMAHFIELGFEIGAIDIHADGVTIHRTATHPGNDYDRWDSKDKNRDQATRRS